MKLLKEQKDFLKFII